MAREVTALSGTSTDPLLKWDFRNLCRASCPLHVMAVSPKDTWACRDHTATHVHMQWNISWVRRGVENRAEEASGMFTQFFSLLLASPLLCGSSSCYMDFLTFCQLGSSLRQTWLLISPIINASRKLKSVGLHRWNWVQLDLTSPCTACHCPPPSTRLDKNPALQSSLPACPAESKRWYVGCRILHHQQNTQVSPSFYPASMQPTPSAFPPYY